MDNSQYVPGASHDQNSMLGKRGYQASSMFQGPNQYTQGVLQNSLSQNSQQNQGPGPNDAINQKYKMWSSRGQPFVDQLKTLNLQILSPNLAYSKVRELIGDDPQYYQNAKIETIRNELIYNHSVNVDLLSIEKAQSDWKASDNHKYVEIKNKYSGVVENWAHMSRQELVTVNRGKNEALELKLDQENELLNTVEQRIRTRPVNDIRKVCAIPSGNCVNLRNTFFEPCHCLIVCDVHALQMTQIFPGMNCPRCLNPIDNKPTVIDDGFEGV